jgi:hypothetical protein
MFIPHGTQPTCLDHCSALTSHSIKTHSHHAVFTSPADFDWYTGRMAFSFCWRYACLPDGFAQSDFSATVVDLSRFNVIRESQTMPVSGTSGPGQNVPWGMRFQQQ